MAPTGIPNPVLAYTPGFLTRVNDYEAHYYDELMQWIGVMPADNDEWRRLAVHWQWIGSTDPKDDMICTFDISNITAGALDSSWTTADYTNVEGKLDTFFTAIAAVQSTGVKLIEYRWYIRSFNPLSESKPFAPHGGPVRVTSKSISGLSSTGLQAPQVAWSVTELTPFPRNWGRFYIPALCTSAITGAPPRFASGNVDTIANAYHTLITTLASSDFQMVVPITSLGVGGRGSPGMGTPNRRLTQVTGIQVDNVPDVIRRRRVHAVTYRKKLP